MDILHPDLGSPRLLTLPTGDMELYVDQSGHDPVGIAIVCHPQPLLGGSAMHKVPHFLAATLRDAGWIVVRPNFRGVGRSSGTHDRGDGETEDILALHQLLRQTHPDARMALLGFSFGAYVQACVARRLAEAGDPAWRVCLAGTPYGVVRDQQFYDTPRDIPHALVVHGEADERAKLSAVMDWARPDGQPVTVVPGADHFFSGKLPLLRRLVLQHLRPTP